MIWPVPNCSLVQASACACQTLYASVYVQVGFSASLGLVQRSGADVDTFMRILRASALYAPTYDKKLGKMLSEDFGTANFPTKVGGRRHYCIAQLHCCAARYALVSHRGVKRVEHRHWAAAFHAECGNSAT